ncbi:MAG: hypothetical protein RRY25_08100, partial [Anaerovorax sp.]
EKDKNYKKCTGEELEKLAQTALAQIEEKAYYAEYLGIYKSEDFLLIGIGAQGKEAKVCSNH